MSWWVEPRDGDEVALSRILRALLLGGLDRSGTTELNVDEARAKAGVDSISAYAAMSRFVFDSQLFNVRGLTGGGAEQHLTVTSNGRQTVGEFGQAVSGSSRRQAARTRLLRWLDEQDGNRGQPADMINSPVSWFYGTQLTFSELSLAGKFLHDLEFIHGQFADGGHLVHARLKINGYTCLERFNGDVAAMQTNARGSVNIGRIDNHSNLAIGSRGVTQTTSLPGNYFVSVADLAGVLQQLAQHRSTTAAAAADATAAAQDLDRIAGTGQLDLTALGRTAVVLRQGASSLRDEPVAVAALIALAEILSPRAEGVTHDW